MRRRRWTSRLKQMALEFLVRDRRFRRSALHYLFSHYLADDILCLVRFDDHQLFVNPRDDKISYTLMSGRPWQRGDLQAAFDVTSESDRLRKDSVFIDVGANIGAITVYACLSGHFRHIVAVEPDAVNRSILEKNIALNGLADQVTVVPAAASSTGGQMTLHRDRKNLGAHSLEPGFAKSPGSTETVTVQSLDQIVIQAGFGLNDIGFVKIDVEGHEIDVLKGMTGILAHCPPILIEATFADSPANGSGNMSLFAALPADYTSCSDVALRNTDSGRAKPTSLGAFIPSSLQHDLVIY